MAACARAPTGRGVVAQVVGVRLARWPVRARPATAQAAERGASGFSRGGRPPGREGGARAAGLPWRVCYNRVTVRGRRLCLGDGGIAQAEAWAAGRFPLRFCGNAWRARDGRAPGRRRPPCVRRSRSEAPQNCPRRWTVARCVHSFTSLLRMAQPAIAAASSNLTSPTILTRANRRALMRLFASK